MKSAEKLLLTLNGLDIKLSAANGKLRCNAPKGAMTPQLRDAIKQDKPDLLRLLDKPIKKPVRGGGRVLSSVAREGELPLSFSQQRIWLLSKLDLDNHFIGNIHFTFRLVGSLDLSALEKAINAIIQRHEVFRIACKTVNNHSLQALIPEINFHLSEHDLSHLPVEKKERIIKEKTRQSALAPFDLSVAPILRAKLLKTWNDDYVFLLTTHLYLFDGWSTALLFKELSSLYSTFHRGEVSSLTPLVAQYSDFAHWHRHWFEGEEARKQSRYWQDKLQDTQLVTALPFDHHRQAAGAIESDCVEFTLPNFLTEAIRNLSQQAGTTLFISLMATFQSLLYGYTRQEKLATGTIVSNRKITETEQMIGSFANNILIASDFSPTTTFNDLLDQVKKSSSEAYANLDIPFEQLLGNLNANLTENPLFRVMFVLHQHQSQSNQTEGLTLTGLNVKKLADVKMLSKYDLELVMVDRNGILSGLFAYNAHLFDHTTIESLKDNFLLVLKQVTDNSALYLEDLPFFQQGKIDNITVKKQINKQSTAPCSATESVIISIWKELFGYENINVHDRFTDLGGHSLLLIRMLMALKEEFNMDIELANMQMFSTVSQLAVCVDDHKKMLNLKTAGSDV